MDAAVASILNRFLGEWLEDLNAEQFKMSVFSGKIRLGPIKVKGSAIDKLGLPFVVKYGYVRSIAVDVDWLRVTSKPLVIAIEDVFVLASTRPSAQWSEEVEVKNQAVAKESSLVNFEVVSEETFKAPGEAGFAEKMVAKIVDNLQITLSGVYIRLEDDTASISPYSIGLVLGKVEAVTCNAVWKPQFLEDSRITYKRVSIENLSLFLDYGAECMVQCSPVGTAPGPAFEALAREEVKIAFRGVHKYLLAPAVIDLKAVLRKDNEKFTQPEIEANLVIGTTGPIHLGVETPQLTHGLKLGEFYSAFSQFQAGVLGKINCRKWSEGEAAAYRALYSRWLKGSKKPTDTLTKELLAMEEGHAYEEITTMRTFLRKEEQIDAKALQLKSDIEREKSPSTLSGVKNFFGWGDSEAAETEKKRKVAAAESELSQVEQSKKALLDRAQTGTFAEPPKQPADYIGMQLRAELPTFKLSIRSASRPIATMELSGLVTEVGMRAATMVAKVQTVSLTMSDEVAQSPVFPNILQGGELKAVYDQTPEGPINVVVRTSRLFIVGNLPCFLTLSEAMMTALADQFDIDYYRKAAGDKVAAYVSEGQKYMADIINVQTVHQPMVLDVHIQAPCALIPLNIMEAKQCLVADFGQLMVKTRPAPAKNPAVDYSKIMDESLIYDFYTVVVENMRVGTLWEFATMEKWAEGRFTPIFKPSPLYIEVGQAIAWEETSFPGLLARVRLDEMGFFLSDAQLLLILRLQDRITDSLATLPKPRQPASDPVPVQSKPKAGSALEEISEKPAAVVKAPSQHFEFAMGGLGISLERKNRPMLDFRINELKTLATIGENGDILAEVSIRDITIRDKRNGVYFTHIMGKPDTDLTISVDVNPDDIEILRKEEAVQETEAQIYAKVKIRAIDQLTEVLLTLNSLRLCATSDFVKEMLEFPNEAFDTIQEEKDLRRVIEDRPASKLLAQVMAKHLPTLAPLQELKVTTISTKLLATVLVQELQLWVPEHSKNPDSKVVNLYMDVMTRYSSFQVCKVYTTPLGVVTKTEMVKIDDEATVGVTKFGLVSAYMKDQKLIEAEEDNSEILKPSRLELEYRVTRHNSPTKTYLEAQLESLDVDIGFRDLLHFQALANAWSQVSPAGPAPAHAEAVPVAVSTDDEIRLDVKMASVEITLMDDTASHLLSLLYLEMNNVSAALAFSPQILEANFACGVKVNYFNSKYGCWEPIVEEWAVDVDAKQASASTPILVQVQAPSLLNLNLTCTMGETIALLMQRLSEDEKVWEREKAVAGSESGSNGFTGTQIVYKLKNRLGTEVTAWIEGGPRDKREVWTLPHSGTKRFGQNQIDRVRSGQMAANQRKYASLMQNVQSASALGLEVKEIGAIPSLIIDELKTLTVMSHVGTVFTPVVADISSKGGQRVISLESILKLVNNTPDPLEIANGRERIKLGPGKLYSVPLKWLSGKQPTQLVTPTGLIDLQTFNGIVTYEGDKTLAVDYAIIKSGSSDPQASPLVPHQRLVIFNAPFTIHNLTPGVLRLFRGPAPEPVCVINPGVSQQVMHDDPKNAIPVRWELQLSESKLLKTELVTQTKELSHFHLTGDIPADKLSVQQSPMSFVKTKDVDLKYKAVEEEKWNGVVMQVYCQFWILNKTPYALEFTGKREFLKVKSLEVGTVKDKKSQMKLRVAAEEFGEASEWCKPFNIQTIGIAGSLQLNNSAAASGARPAPNIIQLGVMLASPQWPLVKSVIVRIQPRFMIVNALPFLVYVRQDGKERVAEFAGPDAAPFQLENAKVGKAIQISCDRQSWSSPFNIEDIDDLQVRFKGAVTAVGPAPSSSTETRPVTKQLSGLKMLQHTEKWHRPSPANDYFHYVRVAVATEDGATLFVRFMEPLDPEYLIWNKTQADLTVCQVGCSIEVTVKPESRGNFAFDNHLSTSKKVRVSLGSDSQSYAIDKLKAFTSRLAGNKVKVVTEGVTRVLVVEPDIEESGNVLQHSGTMVLALAAAYRFEQIKAKIVFRGIVVSLIDDIPKERFVFSLTGISISASQSVDVKLGGRTMDQAIKLHIDNIQLDDMLARPSQFPVMLGLYVAKQEETEGPVPFFQFRVEKESFISSKAADSIIEHYKHLALLIQPMKLQVHQETITGLLGVATRLQEAFSKKEGFWRGDSLQTVDFQRVCPDLCCEYPKPSNLAGQVSAKAYFEFVNINSMKVILSFRSAKSKSSIKVDPREAFGIVNVISSVGGAFITITDSPLRFSSVIVLNSFQTFDALSWTITKNYIRQGALQFYKVIGSSDLIGNPMGLIDKLGTGVFEFFNEPRKGLLKGPKQFATGVGKGVKSLVSGIISGGFGSVSRITGSLYSVVRQVGGEGDSYERINQNDNIAEGIYHGFKGGLQDLAEGVTGLFTKPFKGAKGGGVKGFFKGIGSGLLGVATAPLSAVLRVGTSVTTGIANTATFLRTGKIQQKGRLRFPRPVSAQKVIEPYNEEIAQAQEFLTTLKDHNTEQLVFYLRIDSQVIVLITTEAAVEIRGGDLHAALPIQSIDVCELHQTRSGFVLVASGRVGTLAVRAQQFAGLAKLYGILKTCARGIQDSAQVPRRVRVRKMRR